MSTFETTPIPETPEAVVPDLRLVGDAEAERAAQETRAQQAADAAIGEIGLAYRNPHVVLAARRAARYALGLEVNDNLGGK